MLDQKILITKIQRFSLHDGPGIRTTVFLKGCSLHCPWCCNPENILLSVEPYWRNGIESLWGEWYSQEELYKELTKDKAFYDGELERNEFLISNYEMISKLPGGITFSGGEALLQISSYKDLLIRLASDNIHRTVETSLFVSKEHVKMAIECFDLFYVDVKFLIREECKQIIGGDLDFYLSNFELLQNTGKPIILRIPVIGGYTDKERNTEAILDWLLKIKTDNIIKIELLKGHHLADQKYLDLKKSVPLIDEISDEKLDNFKNRISQTGIMTEIKKI